MYLLEWLSLLKCGGVEEVDRYVFSRAVTWTPHWPGPGGTIIFILVLIFYQGSIR